jgi:hypothetical protein
MLRSIRVVYERQWPIVQGNAAAEPAFHRGLALLTNIFIDCLAENVEDAVRAGEWEKAIRSWLLLAHEHSQRVARTSRFGQPPAREMA